MTSTSYKERLAAWKKARFSPPPEPDLTPGKPDIIDRVPMRDGVRLYTEIFLPEDYREGRRYPVILIRSPYPYSRPSRHDPLPIARYLQAGYAFVFQLCRGQGQSEGTFSLFSDVEDGYDCIHWISERHWSNRHVGMQGASFQAFTQLCAARTRPPALKCIMPTAFIGNRIQCFPYANGVPMRAQYMQWCTVADTESMADLDMPYGDMGILEHERWGPALRHRPLMEAADSILSDDKLQLWHDNWSHPYDDDYWAPIHFTDAQLAELDIPIFFTDGWYDLTIGPINYFSRLQQLKSDNKRWLLVGPWNHYQTYSHWLHNQDNGNRNMPENAAMDLVAQRIAFFDKYLKNDTDIQDSDIQPERVQVYITGANVWKTAPTFPLPGTRELLLYLHSEGDAHNFPQGGTLSAERPSKEVEDHYIYDPLLPPFYQPLTFKDNRALEIRADVLTYTTVPLREPLTILGAITLQLHAATDGRDTDWFALVTEVFPDGQSIAFHGPVGVLRARYHKGLDREVLLTPGVATEFTLSLGPAGHQLAVGNCLRLCIFSAAFPAYDPNTNTGNPVATDIEYRIAKQTIYHTAGKASCLRLPVINLDPIEKNL